MLKLYQPDKYKVYIGKKPQIALCTCWNEPKRIFENIENEIGITGTLYSKFGVNIILRNLALNPNIRKIYIWGQGPLSNSEIGKAGKEFLISIWKNKNDINNYLKDNKTIDKEINIETLSKILNNVELIDTSQLQIEDLLKTIKKDITVDNPYMDSIDFPEPIEVPVDTFPAEDTGWLIHENTIAEAWTRTVEKIYRYGFINGTQYGYRQKQLVGVTWIATKDEAKNIDLSSLNELPNEIKETIIADKKMLEQYNKEVFEETKDNENIAYTYGNRLYKYTYKNKSINQVEKGILENLKKSINSRRAFATTFIPFIDAKSSEPPCLVSVQALYNNNKLHILAVFRSHDIFKAGLSNAYGLLSIQEKLCSELKVEKGYLQITSQSAHIYEQDWNNVEKMSKCFYWDREPSMYFDATKDADPRGNIIVTVENKKIIVTLQSLEGQKMLSLEGENSKYLCNKLAQLQVFNKIGHALDIAQQIQKAEIAIKLDLEFNQDQPLKFN